ncbi:hypothetical protein [Amycolatopsis tolypomycina]|uniref:Uncharacterized protein n=1 Tax=Amycolatopsis tolypomycina TaxID=208445 RepID=A0A1H4T086_9PSEU|nr:hypothetical protein [Amycolatopsis tolypomycina]SEC49863.1 hypothetical protein SAMN04489727_3973 [Amycolatopsis tolypomycina]
MSGISTASFPGTLEPLEYGGREVTIACTPAAVDLAAVGLGAAGIGYFAAKAFYHKHVGHFDDREDLLDSGVAQDELLSSSDLLSVRVNELTRS